jgi:hypothetical protein
MEIALQNFLGMITGTLLNNNRYIPFFLSFKLCLFLIDAMTAKNVTGKGAITGALETKNQ